jgi:2-polyprenyl-3-methyl-5-hydroxy-6-metoxy-1,4-benzoquinol methylase
VNSPQKPHPAALPELLDPVTAYDRLAPYYSQFSLRRAAYLRGVEKLIGSRIPAGAASLLDVGSGDGSRALRIASAAGISRVVLLEPSSRMAGETPAGSELWRVRIEDIDLARIVQRFDVITCLWNVFGHIANSEKRIRALANATQLLSPDSLLFVDVIHRYNVRSYGGVMTAARWLRDWLAPSETNGDVVARWQTQGGEITTYGHVFTEKEMRRLTKSAGLECVERVVIDYQTGETRNMSCLGNLLYVLQRTS